MVEDGELVKEAQFRFEKRRIHLPGTPHGWQSAISR
jgi:hypothetical protein